VDKKIVTISDSSNPSYASNISSKEKLNAGGPTGVAAQPLALYLFITYRNFTALKITFLGLHGDKDALHVWDEIQKWMNASMILLSV
jgi:hypothetical protein